MELLNQIVPPVATTPVKSVPLKVDNRLYNTIWAEAAGGSPDEIRAVTSVFLNRAQKEGYEKALQGSSAYKKQSKQYIKASTGDMNIPEKVLYRIYKVVIDDLVNNPDKALPYTYFENLRDLKTRKEPSWVKNMASSVDIGRQRFYIEKQNPRVKALSQSNK